MLSNAAVSLREGPNWSLKRTVFPITQFSETKWSLRTERMAVSGTRRSGRSAGRIRFVVRAGYKKIPMETAGAYHLVDEESGEKFIVWGGSEEDAEAAVMPSKDVLTWKPKSGSTDDEVEFGGAGGKRAPARVLDGGYKSPVPINSAYSSSKGGGNFERLKTHKINALAKKVSRMKQEVEEQVVEDNYTKRSTVANSEDKYAYKGKKGQVLGREMSVAQRDRTQMQDVDVENDEGEANERRYAIVEESRIYREKVRKSEYSKTRPDVSVTKKPVPEIRGWNRGDSMQRYGYEPEYPPIRWPKSADKEFFSRKSFRDIGCKDYMIECLRVLGFSRPSNIQAMSFGPVFEGKSSVIADQSGSGKTLAYLVPVIQRIREEELQGLSKSSSQSPRVLILAPTAELASQVLSNCRALSKNGVPFRSMVVTGGFKQKTQLESLQQEMDVLIATPGRFLYLIREGFLKLTNIRCAVLDEVDILYDDEEFELSLQTLMNSAPVTTQYLFVTATLPVDIYNKLVETFPDSDVVIGPGMHRTSTGLEEVLVDCSGDEGTEKNPDTALLNKKTALLQLAEENPVSKTIVFCNKIETCRIVENALNRFDRKGIRMLVLPFHAAVTQETRLANMKEFLNPRSNKDSLFLVCTDRASRGIDFRGVNHVVLFDFPRDPSEYVRRVGRTARGVGGRGKAFVFVVGKQVSLARRIMDRNQKGHPLHDVPTSF
uniref:Uncharacterized protein n=2 Tax=Kalanchoe fedtschenkoi TaxID=63787 RepID=A0A7N0T1Z2_KALFE